jgi:hypothetical protein
MTTTIEPCDGADGCPLCAADLERRRRYLAAQSRYNTSVKGQRRNREYEKRRRPGRVGWEPARNALRAAMPPAPDRPMHDGADLPPDPAVFGLERG